MDCKATGNIRSLMIASLVGMLLPAPGVSAAEPGDSRLADAVMKRDGAAVRALLGQKVDANVPGKDGTPALHWSVREDDLATARLLLGAGADATTRQSLRHYAALSGLRERERGDDPAAARCGRRSEFHRSDRGDRADGGGAPGQQRPP